MVVELFVEITYLSNAALVYVRYQCARVKVRPEVTVKDAEELTVQLLTLTFEFNKIVPLLMITSVNASGNVPQLQLFTFSHAVLTEPVHVSVKRILNLLLLVPFTTQRY